MKAYIDIDTIEVKHIASCISFVKSLELKSGNLSQLTFNGIDESIVYSIWHNKKSFTITSQVVKNG